MRQGREAFPFDAHHAGDGTKLALSLDLSHYAFIPTYPPNEQLEANGPR